MINKLLNSNLVKNNLIFFVGAVLTGALNYALYPIMARFVSVRQFGELQLMLSLVLQLSIVFNVVRIFVVNVVSNSDDDQKNSVFIHEIERILGFMGMGIGLVLLVASPLLRDFFKFESVAAFIPLIAILLFNFPFTTRIGFIHANKLFGRTAFIQWLAAFVKLVFALGAALLGWGIAAILWAVSVSKLVVLYYTSRSANKAGLQPRLGKPKTAIRAQIQNQLGDHGRYLVLVGIIAGSIAFLLSIDSVLVKHYFSPEEHGQYAAITVVARTIFFITSSVSGVLLASVKVKDDTKQSMRIYLGSLGLVGLLGGGVLLLLKMFPVLIIEKLIGTEYLDQANLLPKLGLAMLAISLINLLLYYHLALRDYAISKLAILGSAIVLLVVLLNHATLEAVVNSFTIGTLGYLLLLAAWSSHWHSAKLKS